MFVRTLDDLVKAGMLKTPTAGTRSARYLTAADGLGFSYNDNHIAARTERMLWYKNHWEGNLILDGTLEVTDRATGKVHSLGPGGLYVVGPKDRHHVKAVTDGHLISVFDPPLTGTETHDKDGAYPPTGPVPKGPAA